MATKMAVVFFCALFAGAAASGLEADFSDKDWMSKGGAVQKVVKLLTEMQNQLEKEQDEDQEIYDKMECWCETNDKAKNKAIMEGKRRAKALTADVLEYTSKSASLKVDLETLEKEIKENRDAQAESTAIRGKEAAEFHEDEKNAIQSITGLKDAVTVLSKANGQRVIELPQESLIQVRKVLSEHLGKDGEKTLVKLGMSQKQIRRATSFLQQSSSLKVDAPASGEIFGVLQGMKESFETNLASSSQDEADAKNKFNQLKSAKSEELAASTQQRDNKKADLADTDDKLATAKDDLEDTEAQIEADTTFLADLKERCGNMDEMWAARSKVRTEEMQSVSEAMEILTSDDSKDLMGRSTSFMQISASRSQRSLKSRERAAKVLRDAAKKTGNPQLSTLAILMKSDVFQKIKEAIDGMTAQLAQEQKDEVKHRDWCTKELNQNTRTQDAKYDEKADLQTTIANLKTEIATLGDELATAAQEKADTQMNLKRAAEDRSAQNKEFQMTVTDQQATQEILTKALDRLKAFYIKKEGGKSQWIQLSAHTASASGQAPPPGFGGSYKKSKGSNSVMQMIDGIISESKKVEKDAHEDEQAAQEAYEALVKDSNDEITALDEEMTTKTEVKAKAEENLVAAEADLMRNYNELKELSDYAGGLHQSCDFTLKYFTSRQQARSDEIDALNQAKSILSGADPEGVF